MLQSNEANDHGGMILSSRPSVISSVIIVIIVFSVVGSYVFLTNQYVPSNVAVVVLEPGFGDRSMADQAYRGLTSGDIVVSYDFRVAEDIADLTNILDTLAASRDYDLILVIGTQVGIQGAVQSVASDRPGQKFGYIGGIVDLPNVASATFAYEEGSFIAGALAAHLAVENENRTGVVGIIGSVETDPTVAQYIDGFIKGVNYANQTLGEVKLLPTEYVGSYNDSSTAEVIARNMWNPANGNASVIFAPVRASIVGIRSAMDYANETWLGLEGNNNNEPFVIAAEGDQRYMGNPDIEIASGPSWVVTSVVPRTDLSIFRVLNATLWGDFIGAANYGGGVALDLNTGLGDLANNGIILADMEEFGYPDWVTIPMINMTADLRLAIINGTIDINAY